MSVATITTANTSTITATEWSPQEIESSMDAMVSPSSDDLFDGDILGDELMDIYNAAVVGGGDDDEDMNELPSLLGHTELVDGEKKDDDGFGAFRPSTSFNDLYKCAAEDLGSEPAIVNGNVETTTTTSSSDVLPPVVSSTSLSPDLVLTTQKITPTPNAPSIVITTTNVAAPTTSLVGGNSGTKRKITAVNATTTGFPALKRRVSIGGRKHTGPSSGTKKVSKKKLGTNTPNPLASLTTTTTNVKIEPTKSILVPVKVEPVSQVIPHVGVSPQADVVLSSNNKATSSVPVATTITIPATSTAAKTITVASKLKTKSVAASSTTPAPILSNPPTEADFKSVAQAAVNTLIMNSSRVDTSTEHVKALTGSNWVAVCGGGSNSGNITSGDVGGDTNNNNINNSTNQNANDKNCNRARRSNLTPDERARQNRDRNREHARNTRLRKKAYVEELKATLSALVTHRDAADLEKRHASQRELEQREVRFRVLEEFLKLRGRNEANPARWSAILEDTFHLTLPVTNFRDMVRSNGEDNNNKSHEQVLTGVTEVMNDSNLCSTFLQSLNGKGITSETIALSYNSDRNDFFMDNCVAMLDWSATTSGSTNELIVKGQIRAKFCPASNKLISAVMRFDTGAVVSQVNCIAKIKESSEVDAAEAAAQYAANEADALLDSLQMPHFEVPTIPAKINYVPPSSVSSANSDDNSDDDKDDLMY
ncbi:hypothetical protein FRACYDRAFT_264423 [Fragilariopsis cylindrus CCMP1102]|uniref:BZIP domain-containing protein n=1 Tax=Fragilariopsis cylindrus CCMP1102 TaxID=635003 RepID=A0A1E7ESH5_9STRA|nr:hypothetical protein FRACYDRAFT_264423 [Fragilariopsis cylindrus CCMP1102]|eukprot:OEU08805.1 hypothetical protein FRACYDRAFT_264423 [Fragilariopsis cylindrus CCMP1102]